MLRATFEMRPTGSASLLAPLRGQVVDEDDDGTVVLDLPEENWGPTSTCSSPHWWPVR
ncbi:MAG: hypothetical protein WKG07_45935 [Hymenobacter sp.]